MTWTTLHDACERQDTAEILVRTKVHPEEAVREDDRGATPLHIACWTNPPLSVVEALIQAFPGAIQDQDVHGDTPLHVALTNPETNPDVIQALLEACPSAASIPNKEGLYPLHKACRYGATEQVVNALLEAYPEALRTHIKVSTNSERYVSKFSRCPFRSEPKYLFRLCCRWVTLFQEERAALKRGTMSILWWIQLVVCLVQWQT
jgi:ankyrin repeat protein